MTSRKPLISTTFRHTSITNHRALRLRVLTHHSVHRVGWTSRPTKSPTKNKQPPILLHQQTRAPTPYRSTLKPQTAPNPRRPVHTTRRSRHSSRPHHHTPSHTISHSSPSTPGPVFSTATRANLNRAIQGGLAPATAKKYKYSVRQFTAFCDSERIPLEDRMPASEDLLCAFAASGVGRTAGTTARNAIAGIRAWHIEVGATWNGSSRLARTLRGVDLLAPTHTTRPQRRAITVPDLDAIIQRLDPANSLQAAVACIASVAFWGQARLGELIPDTNHPRDASIFPHIRHIGRLSPSRKSRTIFLPYTKTHRRLGDTITVTNQVGPSNPLPLLTHHIHASRLSPSDPICCFRSGTGTLSFLSKKVFMKTCNDLLKLSNRPLISGHCFRIGGSTTFLLAGIPPDTVKKMGRWRSDAFLRYWREEQNLAELFATNIHAS